MPIWIKAGWNQKNGKEPFGSFGSCVEFEIELDDSFVSPEKNKALLEQVRTLQMLAKTAVEMELSIATAKHRDALEIAEAEAAQRHDDRLADEERERRETGERPPDGATRSTARRDEPNHAPSRREGTYNADRDEVEYHDDEPRPTRPRDEPRPERRRDDRDVRSRGQNDDGQRRRRDERGGGGGNGRYKDWRNSGGTPSPKQLFGFCKDFDKDADEGTTPTADWFRDFGREQDFPKMFQDWAQDDVSWAVKEWRKERSSVPMNRNGNGAAY